MRIKFWGVRGSLPSSLSPQEWTKHIEELMQQFFDQGFQKKADIERFLQTRSAAAIGGFGTATSCVEVIAQNKSLIIDGGSGLRNLSDALAKQNQFDPPSEYHFLMTHFHFDHILGLPFFSPHFSKGKKINYYIVQEEGERVIREMFKKPIFPVGFEHLEAQVTFHKIQPYKKIQINGFEVTPYLMDHPDPCYGFRIEHGGKVYAHAVDNEAIRTTKAQLGEDAGLFEKANLMFFDAQYDESDMSVKKGWGHGTCDRGFEIARHFGVQQILFAHHDPSLSIEDISLQKKKAEISFKKQFPDLKLRWDFAVEGQEVEI
jgi:phosphoribosyl 1,2-cyclic phosphodiesterase